MKKIILPGLIAICLLVSLLAGCSPGAKEGKEEVKPKTITIVDSAGRNVEVPYPADKVVLLSADNCEMSIILGAEDKIVGVEDGAVDYADIGSKFKDIPSVGHFSEFNVEKVVELDPDVVLGYETSIEKGLVKKLENFGIPFVVCPCNDIQTFEKDVRVLGKILGKEKRAEEFLDFHNKIINLITDRTKKVKPSEKPRVYLECSWKPWRTYGKDSDIRYYLDIIGAKNVGAELSGEQVEVSTEWVLAKDPEAIFVGASSSKVGPDPTPLKEIRNEVMQRPAFQKANITAIENGNVHVLGWRVYKGARFAIGLLHMAKWCHPQLFTDVDPEQIHRELMQRFMGIELENVWIY